MDRGKDSVLTESTFETTLMLLTSLLDNGWIFLHLVLLLMSFAREFNVGRTIISDVCGGLLNLELNFSFVAFLQFDETSFLSFESCSCFNALAFGFVFLSFEVVFVVFGLCLFSMSLILGEDDELGFESFNDVVLGHFLTLNCPRNSSLPCN